MLDERKCRQAETQTEEEFFFTPLLYMNMYITTDLATSSTGTENTTRWKLITTSFCTFRSIIVVALSITPLAQTFKERRRL